MLADGDRLFDEVPEILGDLGGKSWVEACAISLRSSQPRSPDANFHLQQQSIKDGKDSPLDLRIRRILLPIATLLAIDFSTISRIFHARISVFCVIWANAYQ